MFLTPGYVPELNTFLFGNILTINSTDLFTFLVFTLSLIAFFAWKYRQIVACAFDRDFARVSRLPYTFINTVMTVMTALCIVLTIRLVGVMLLMSMLSLPIMTAEVYLHRFRPLMFASILISVAAGITGLMLGAVIEVPCSALIVIVLAALYIVARLIKCIMKNSKIMMRK